MSVNHNDPAYDPEDPGNKPKFQLKNPQIFTKTREILGNIIVNRMETSGGADVDWLIEHNGHFILWEVRTFNDDIVTISKAQMSMFQTLFHQLKSCDFFFIAHNDIDFKNPREPVWIFSNREWENGLKEKSEKKSLNSSKYILKRDMLRKTDVKILRSMIDASWKIGIR